MNITKTNTDNLNATLTIKLGKDDYESRVAKVLEDYRKKASIKGFRPGKVPASLISKMYRKAVLVDEINKTISESLNNYIKEEKINILGDPMPSESKNKAIDWDNDEEFEFAFDLGLAPEFALEVGSKDKIASYQIKVDDKLIETYTDSYTRRFGKFIEVDAVADNEMIKGELKQVDNKGNAIEGGVLVENASILLELSKDEKEKKAFKGAKVGETVKFDVKKLFPNDAELTSLLKISKEELDGIEGHFSMSIAAISRFDKAELNKELFDSVFGVESNITTEQEFKDKIVEDIKLNLKRETDFRFTIDVKEYLLKKVNIALPAEFLKRWLTYVNEGKFTAEQIEAEFPLFENDMKWQLVKSKIVKDNSIEVKEEEIVEVAKANARMQFAQYGINNMPEEQIDAFAVNMLKREGEARRMIEKAMEDKVISYVRDNVTINSKEVTTEEFNKLFEKK
jgi:trigger factor